MEKFSVVSECIKKWWDGTPTELTMDEVMELESEYKEKLVKSKSSVVVHSIWNFWLRKWAVLVGLLISAITLLVSSITLFKHI